MLSPSNPLSMDTSKVRSILKYLALVYLALFICGGLAPLDFRALPWPDVWQTLLSIGTQSNQVSLTDRVTNIALGVPLAFFGFGAMARSGRPLWNVSAALLIWLFCILVAVALEALQVFLPTRTSEWGDVIAQAIGACIGILLWLSIGNRFIKRVQGLSSRHLELGAQQYPIGIIALAAIPYIFTLLALNGWFNANWLALSDAIDKARALHLAPFYYAYSASIVWAAASMLKNLLLYAPIGVGFWVWPRTQRRSLRFSDMLSAGAVSGCVALVMEGGKLFLPGKHPDSTNVLLAACGAAFTLLLLPLLVGNRTSLPSPAATENSNDSTAIMPKDTTHPLRFIGFRFAALAAFAGTAVGIGFYPLGSAWLGAAVVLYTALLWKYPAVWLLVIPALLPTFDLAPWTGWFFANEFDLFVLATIGTGLWICAAHPPHIRLPRRFAFLLTLFIASTFISLLIGLLPLPTVDLNAFSNYYSRYNALRVAKGLVEALALLPLLTYNMSTGVDVPRRFSSGMVMGLAGAVVASVWERAVFPGFLDFSHDYRISALFSSMHTGGCHLEAYLVASLPFLVAWAYFRRSIAVRGVAVGLFILGTYAILVTFSRGGYAGLVASLSLLLAGGMTTWRAHHVTGRRTFSVLTGLALVIGGLTAVPILTGSFAQSRLAQADSDLAVRFKHWRNVLNVIDPGVQATTFGMGLGRFPETYFFRNTTGDMPANYRFKVENDNAYLSLGSGKPAYVEQVVRVKPDTVYRLAVDLRSNPTAGSLNLLVCERTLFKSFNCTGELIAQHGPGGNWSHHELSFNSGVLGSGPWFARRTVKLVLENTSHGSVLDVDNVHLVDGSGTELVANGDFSRGNERWFYSAFFNHWPWHIENIWVDIVFEQGWLGLITFSLMLLYGLAAILKAAWQSSIISIVVLASLGGFLCVGLFGSPLETPRLALLFYLTLFAGILTATSKQVHEITTEPERTDHPKDTLTDASQGITRPLLHTLGGIVILVTAAWLIMHTPAVPYNVRDLLHPVHPLSSLVVLSLFTYWSLGFPVIAAYWLTSPHSKTWIYPAIMSLHAAVGWALIIFSVSFDRIHKIVGAPVLGWPWHWEASSRLFVLFSALSLSITAGTLLAVSLIFKRRAGAAWLSWAITTIVASPFLYWVIVTKAATDNITELMADGGSVLSCVLLSTFVALIAFGGSLLVAQSNAGNGRSRSVAWFGVAVTFPLAYLALGFGTENALVKYGHVFSALQFILSPDREHYVQGPELTLRYVLFHMGALGTVFLVQYPICAWLFKHPSQLASTNG